MSSEITVAGATRIWTEDNYVKSRVLELWKGREALTALEVLDLDISWRDRLWLLFQGEMVSTQAEAKLSCLFAEHTLLIFEKQSSDDARPREALEVARRRIDEKVSHEEKVAAYNKAFDASHSGGGSEIDAASMAAYAVAQATCGSLLGSSSGAVSAAELDAPGDYPSAASRVFKAAEEEWQTEQVRHVLTEEA